MTRAIAGISAVFGIVLAGTLAVTAQGQATGQAAASRPAQSTAANAPTFTKDVAPVLYKHCTSCHRPGEIAPMSLLTYEEARPGPAPFAKRSTNGTMPPWHADPAHGKWQNDRRLSAAEKDVITLGRRRRAAGRSAGPAARSDLRGGLGDRAARPRRAMDTAYDVPAQRRDPVSVLRGRDQLHRGQVGPSPRDSAGRAIGRPPRAGLRARSGHDRHRGAFRPAESSGRSRVAAG